MPESLILDCKKLGIKSDHYMYQGVLLEYSAILVNRISNLPMDIQKQAFLYARDVLEKNYQMKFDEELPSK